MAGGLSVSPKGTSNSRWLADHGGLVRRSPQRSCDVRYAGRPTMFAKLKLLYWLPSIVQGQNNWNLTPINGRESPNN